MKADKVRHYHDAITAVYNSIKTEADNKAFKKNLGKMEFVEYSDDDNEFVVQLPTEANDLVVEGAELRHCVKSYISRVANGSTNIVFIRRKKELDKPFFTVEIDNEHIIQQVHGFANCNASSVEGLTEFIDVWAKKKKLGTSNIDKVR
jgi:hypothetical protein